MANAERDANHVPSILGISSSDATATVPVAVDPATNRMLVTAIITSGGGGGSDVNIASIGGNTVTTTLPVSGTVTANAGTNLNTSLLALESGGNLATAVASLSVLDDWDETDRAKVNPIVGQAGVQAGAGAVSATTQRVVLATDTTVPVTSVVPGTGATNLGKAEDGAHTTGDVGVFALSVRNDTPNATLAANVDYQQISTDMVGGVRTALYETDFAVLGTNHVKKYYTNAGAVTDGIVWSPASGKRWYVTDIFINTSAAATITLEDDLTAGDSVVWKAELAANSGWSHTFTTPLFSGEDAADLLVTTSAGNVYIMVTGYEI